MAEFGERRRVAGSGERRTLKLWRATNEPNERSNFANNKRTVVVEATREDERVRGRVRGCVKLMRGREEEREREEERRGRETKERHA